MKDIDRKENRNWIYIRRTNGEIQYLQEPKLGMAMKSRMLQGIGSKETLVEERG